MTTAITAALETASENSPSPQRRLSKAEQRAELDRMGETMVEQGGLLNVAQAAIALDVSRERVYELLGLCLLKKFEFLGRIYLSFDQVKERRDADVKAGRPPRTLPQRIKANLKAAAQLDGGQIKRGGTTPYAARLLAKELAKKKAKGKK